MWRFPQNLNFPYSAEIYRCDSHWEEVKDQTQEKRRDRRFIIQSGYPIMVFNDSRQLCRVLSFCPFMGTRQAMLAAYLSLCNTGPFSSSWGTSWAASSLQRLSSIPWCSRGTHPGGNIFLNFCRNLHKASRLWSVTLWAASPSVLHHLINKFPLVWLLSCHTCIVERNLDTTGQAFRWGLTASWESGTISEKWVWNLWLTF